MLAITGLCTMRCVIWLNGFDTMGNTISCGVARGCPSFIL